MDGWNWLISVEWYQIFGSTPLEIIATLSAVLGVVLIARQNILGWPFGLVWAVISTWLAFTVWDLVSDGILYLSYIPIQIYCWVVWYRGGNTSDHRTFRPSWLPGRRQFVLVVAAAVCVWGWGNGVHYLADRFDWIPVPSLLWRDSTTTVLNYYAQFLQARKRMENWVVWLVVNLLSIHIYYVKDSPIYCLQYGIFLFLGLYGWYQWSRSVAGRTS